jgi:hypothetical protein
VSALYDVLFVSVDRLVAPDAEVACVEMDEVVSFLSGGDADWPGVGGRCDGVAPCGVLDSSPLVLGGASIRLGAGCMLETWLAHSPSSGGGETTAAEGENQSPGFSWRRKGRDPGEGGKGERMPPWGGTVTDVGGVASTGPQEEDDEMSSAVDGRVVGMRRSVAGGGK